MKRLLCSILSIAVLILGLWPAAGGAQQPITIRLGHVGFPGPGSIFDIMSTRFARDVNEALKGRVEVKVFHSSQLGTDEAMIKGIRVGAPEMHAPSTIMSTVDPRYGVFEMPYLIVSRAHMKKVAENKEVQKALFDVLPARGIRLLGVWENGFRHITTNSRPIVRPEDLKGIKLRVPGVAARPIRQADVIIFGAETAAQLARLTDLRDRIKRDGMIWAVTPKGKGGVKESDVMAAGKAAGLVDVKVAAFSATHTACKFVIPRALR
jgi:TRAP-type C4-dicarboxylate transport system substrate-binding protein